MTNTSDPHNRWAVVLGVSSGTGAAVARAVARDPGYHVFGAHRGHYPAEAAAVSDAVRSLGKKATFHVGDAARLEGIAASVDALERALGGERVGLLVHAIAGASVGHLVPVTGPALEPRQIEKTFDHLAHSFVHWVRALYERGLLAPGARLLGLTNVLVDTQLDTAGVISAAKAALEMYVRYLAAELGPLGYRVNLLKFPTVLTPAVRQVAGDDAAYARLEALHAQMQLAGRMCTLDDVVRVIAYLARPESEWFNGATIDYTGGMTFRLLEMLVHPAPLPNTGGPST